MTVVESHKNSGKNCSNVKFKCQREAQQYPITIKELVYVFKKNRVEIQVVLLEDILQLLLCSKLSSLLTKLDDFLIP